MTVSLGECIGLSLPEYLSDRQNEPTEQPDIEIEHNPAFADSQAMLDECSPKLPDQQKKGKPRKARIYAVVEFDKSQSICYACSESTKDPLMLEDLRWNSLYPAVFDHLYDEELSIHMYLAYTPYTPETGRVNDLCLGVTRFTPKKSLDREWVDLTNGIGKIRITIEFSENQSQSLQPEDLSIIKYLDTKYVGGRRAVWTSCVRKNEGSRQAYAMKKIKKYNLVPQAAVTESFEIANQLRMSQTMNPFIVPVKYAFQTPECIYLLSPLVRGGELLRFAREQSFDVDTIRLYAAEVVCALENLHSLGIIAGNLQEKNILLDLSGHVLLCKFSLWVSLNDNVKRDPLELVAPEVKLGQNLTPAVDWFVLGIVLAGMLAGCPIGYDDDHNDPEQYYFHGRESIDPLARDLSVKLFNSDPTQRLGTNGAAEVKAHPFFAGIDWDKIITREFDPEVKPHDVHFRDMSSVVCTWRSTPKEEGISPALAELAVRQQESWREMVASTLSQNAPK